MCFGKETNDEKADRGKSEGNLVRRYLEIPSKSVTQIISLMLAVAELHGEQ